MRFAQQPRVDQHVDVALILGIAGVLGNQMPLLKGALGIEEGHQQQGERDARPILGPHCHSQHPQDHGRVYRMANHPVGPALNHGAGCHRLGIGSEVPPQEHRSGEPQAKGSTNEQPCHGGAVGQGEGSQVEPSHQHNGDEQPDLRRHPRSTPFDKATHRLSGQSLVQILDQVIDVLNAD